MFEPTGERARLSYIFNDVLVHNIFDPATTRKSHLS